MLRQYSEILDIEDFGCVQRLLQVVETLSIEGIQTFGDFVVDLQLSDGVGTLNSLS